MITNKYSKQEIKNAREIVKYVNDRQKKLTRLALKLKERTSMFTYSKFEHHDRITMFSGYDCLNGLLTGKAVRDESDADNRLIGEYIAVSRALGLNYNDVYELIEENEIKLYDQWDKEHLVCWENSKSMSMKMK